jgi:rhodanese-related sulfurtransferase
MSVNVISASELIKAQAAGQPVDLIDVRTPAEYQATHAQGARSVPLDRLDPQAVMGARGGSADPLYLICRSGTRSRLACEKFIAAGFSNVASVEGGTTAWEKAAGPVVRGKQVMSLERQVRIAAGLLVVLGVVLGLTVSPWLMLLAGFVGAGLVFSGVTDTCGMGMLLARMPWNQAGMQNPQCDAGAIGLERKQA